MDRNKLSSAGARPTACVALRKESVDRNDMGFGHQLAMQPSLSARRAWIEIDGVVSGSGDYVVALRKESVDRNSMSPIDVLAVSGRSPQGERG